ncbi:MAG: T9SS type A sorting domain-containing protein [Bacteroidales bacterium]|nr:T9SS type A sorting domain-containing protein [Bacteroidales bacterium]
MKKTLLFFAAILISVSVFAQTKATFVNEHFDSMTMPAGWQIAGSGINNWSISGSQNAGGAANELHLAWSPQFNGTSRVVMPAVDLTGVTSVVVSFKHALNNYSGSHTIGFATSSDNGTTWNVGWQQNYNSSNSWAVTQSFTTPDMGNNNVQFCLFYTGNSYNINDWYFDDIEIFSQENLDLSLLSVDLSSVSAAGSKDIAFTVQNKGLETVNQVVMTYQFEGFDAVEETFAVNLASLASEQLTFVQPTVLLPGSYTLTVSITSVNGTPDDDEANNTIVKPISITLGSTQKIAMIEHFSSSTCGPCVQPNTQMLNVTNNNPGKFTYTKYQMNWPGNGDPYYTEEGGVRRQYYSVNAVPAIFIEAQEKSAGQAQTVINNVYDSPAFTEVRGSFNVSGNTITVKVDFMSYYDLNTAKAFVTVNEKETHNNVGSNGETSFHHIFMKFLTSPSGNEVNIPAGGYQHFEFTQDMSGTHVEEMSDLEVSAWLQEYGSKEMLNSHFLYEYTDIHPYPVQDLAVTVDGGNLTATWSAPEGGNAQAYNVFVNGELVETVTGYEYNTTVTADFNVVEVQAVYADDMTSVKMAASFGGAPTVYAPVTDLAAEPYEHEGERGALVTWTNPEGATAYKVYVDDELLGTAGNQPIFIGFEGEHNGTYTIGIVAVYEDGESQMATVDFEWLFDAVEETEMTTAIYPNPTTGSFVIENANMAQVEIYNLVGQKVYEAQGDVISVDASNWNKGMYLVNIKNQNGSMETRKLMVK